ncbi:MAG: hypothetical protein RBR34_12175 [Rhodospirillaceae bacterium]|nr:hypothetical protein [Rhodospirillaceae bacterium]
MMQTLSAHAGPAAQDRCDRRRRRRPEGLADLIRRLGLDFLLIEGEAETLTKSSPGYRQGEQAAIAAHIAAHGVTALPPVFVGEEMGEGR